MTKVVNAETEFVTGAATYHLLGTHAEDTKYFKDRWSRDGRLIGSPLFAIEEYNSQKDQTEYGSVKYFAGLNSVGGAMAGRAISGGYQIGLLRYGLIAGFYVQDTRRFTGHGIFAAGVPVTSGITVTPVLGTELIYGAAVKVHLVVTPVLALCYLSFTF